MIASVHSRPRHKLVALVARVWRVHRNRRKTVHLSTLTDAQLKDIGLTRGDVRRALARPFLEDPSTLLTEWATTRTRSSLRQVTTRPIPAPSVICSGFKDQPLAA